MDLINVLILIFAVSFVVGVTAVNLVKKHKAKKNGQVYCTGCCDCCSGCSNKDRQ